MAQRMSQRKKRQIAKRPPEETLLEEILEAAAKYKVLSVGMYYAGSSQEVGFIVHVTQDATPEDVLALCNAMSVLLKGSPEALAWIWTLGIYRGNDRLKFVWPYGFICAACGCEQTDWRVICGHEQEDWMDECSECGAPRL